MSLMAMLFIGVYVLTAIVVWALLAINVGDDVEEIVEEDVKEAA